MATSRYCDTQEALARKSGVAQSTIGRILRGEVNPQTSTMTFLAEALGVPFETLAVAAQGEKSVELPLPEPACDDDCERTERELETLRRGVIRTIKRLERLARGGSEVDLTPEA